MRRRTAVVLVLLGLLGAGLLLPAVSRVREAATRLACQGQFCMRALALHTYAETAPVQRDGKEVAAFPAGTVANARLAPDERLSWCVPVLSFHEEDAVRKQFDLTVGWADPANAAATAHRFRHLVCPASGEHEYGNERRTEVWKSPHPLTHYVGVAGLGADAAALPAGHPRAGVFGYDRRTALYADFPDFPDGTSNTLLLIETGRDPGHWARGGPATVRGFESEMAPYIGPGRPFGGFHTGGWSWSGRRVHICNAAMADGSTRSLTDATDPAVLESLATAGGKEPLPADW